MCTLSWLPADGGHILWHGRDERSTRQPGEAPRLVTRDRYRALAPRDPDAGGTWIGVNELGLTLGLANLYPPEGVAGTAVPVGLVTRGRIIDDLLSADSAATAAAALSAMDPAVFAPFTLAVLEPGSAPELYRWDGTAMSRRTVSVPGLLLTSSGAGRAVEELRVAEYARLAPGSPPGAEDIEALHRAHLVSLGADSFCMHRDEAETASLTRVRVEADTIEMIYVPGPPCRTVPLDPVRLARATAVGSRASGLQGGRPRITPKP